MQILEISVPIMFPMSVGLVFSVKHTVDACIERTLVHYYFIVVPPFHNTIIYTGYMPSKTKYYWLYSPTTILTDILPYIITRYYLTIKP